MADIASGDTSTVQKKNSYANGEAKTQGEKGNKEKRFGRQETKNTTTNANAKGEELASTAAGKPSKSSNSLVITSTSTSSRRQGASRLKLASAAPQTNKRVSKDKDISSKPSLAKAIKANDVKTVTELLNAEGAKETINNPITAQQLTPLLLAARHGSVEIAQLILESGADVNKADRELKTPLHWAASAKDSKPELVKLLLSQPSIKPALVDSKKRTVLHVAAATGSTEIIAALLQNETVLKECLNARDKSGYTPLAITIRYDREEAEKLLLDCQGIDVNIADRKGRIPLHLACVKSKKATVERLIAKKSDVKKPDSEKNTPLHMACTQHSYEIVTMLIKAGADVNVENIYKQTPLHLAIEAEDETISHILTQSGADVAIRYDSALFQKRLHKQLAQARKFAEMSDSSVSSSVDESDSSMSSSSTIGSVLDALRLKVDKNGFIISDNNKANGAATSAKNQKQQQKKEEERVRKWLKMVKNWQSYMAKDPKKVRRRIYKGIPNMLRSQAWRYILDTERKKKRKAGLYQTLLASKADPKVLHQIDVDINRSARNHIQFHERFGMGQICLFNVLKAYSVFDPVVQYCQSMSDVTAIILMYLEEEEAFYALVELCQNPKFRMAGRYQAGFPVLYESFYVFERLLEADQPALYKSIKEAGIDTSFYTMRWFLKLFSDVLPFDMTLRLWDLIFFEGYDILFTIIIVYLRYFSDMLLSVPRDELLMALQRLSSLPESITIDRFVKDIKRNKIDPQILRRLENDYKEYAKKQNENKEKREADNKPKRTPTIRAAAAASSSSSIRVDKASDQSASDSDSESESESEDRRSEATSEPPKSPKSEPSVGKLPDKVNKKSESSSYSDTE